MMKTLIALFLFIALSSFGAVPDYRAFRGTGGILVTSNPPTGNITFDGSGIFTSSGTNATIATSTNGVLVAVASTNINFVKGSNVFLAATNIGSTTHIAINAFTPVPFIEGAVTNLLLTWILPILTVDSLTVSNLLAAPPLSSVQYNSNGITRGSPGFIYTNGQVRVADVVIAGQGVEVTAGSFVLNGGTTALVAWNGLGRIRWDADGVVKFENDAANNFNRVNFRDNTAASPALGITNGDFIVLGGNGDFKLGAATNRLIAPAVHIANDGGMGTPLLSLENPLNALKWDFEINSHAETYILGLGFNDATYAMVVELNGNVGLGITNPTVRLDVQGRFMARSNVYFPNISSNALPVAMLVTDSSGEVYEGAVPQASSMILSNLAGTVGNNVTNVVSLSTTNATSKPITNAYANGTLTLFGVEAGANVTITPNGSNLVIAATAGSASAETNAVLTNLIGTVARNVTNFVSLSTSNATSKPLTNSYSAGVVTVFGIEAGANVTLSQNASNIVITGASSSFAAGNSNQIPFINGAQTGYQYAGYQSITNPGFGFSPSSTVGHGYGGLMVFANSPMGLVTIGHPNAGSDFATFATALVISNRYNGLGDFKNDMVKIDAVLVNSSTLQADSTMTRWRVWQASGSSTDPSTSSNDVAEITIGGKLTLAGGLATNNAAFTITTNNFALDTYYTNMAQRSWVSASIGMTNVLLTEKAWVGLYLDQDGDGTWERTGINVRLQGISALAGVEQLGAFLQPSARFIFTNLGTAANSSIEPNSSQWVKQ